MLRLKGDMVEGLRRVVPVTVPLVVLNNGQHAHTIRVWLESSVSGDMFL